MTQSKEVQVIEAEDHEMTAYKRYEKFIDWRIDHGLSGIEWREANFSKPDWLDEFMKLDCTDEEFDRALSAAAYRKDKVWRKRIGGPFGAVVFVGEFRRLVPKRSDDDFTFMDYSRSRAAIVTDTPEPTPREPTETEMLMAEGFTPIEARQKLIGWSDAAIYERFYPDVSDRLRSEVESSNRSITKARS
jgi:hypothetical protein